MSKKATTPKIEEVKEQLAQAQEREKRVLADYQNLIRRTQDERGRLIQMANRDLVEALIQPLEHLELAGAQLQDKGLAMALEQLRRVLSEFGLEEIEVAGKVFDVETMEAVEGSGAGAVKTVVRKGYRLNGTVLQHAKVILADS